MPTATSEKLNQLRQQLQDCSNPTAAKLLKSTITKLETQLNSGQVQATQAKSSTIDQRKAALRKSRKQVKQKALHQERTTLKPPTSKKSEPQPEAVSQDKKPILLAQDKPKEQAKALVQDEKSKSPTQDRPSSKTEATPQSKNRFPPQAFAAAKRIVLGDSLWQRPQVQGITIDGPTSRDLDDAIWIEPADLGAVLSVHIADVSELVEMGSSLDKVAIERTTTRYFSKGNAPMLPRPLSEDKLSLLESQKRPTLTIQVTLDANAQMIDTKIFESWLTSQKRFTYAEASQPDSHSAFQETLEMAHHWALHLYRNRLTSGAIGATQTAQGQWLTEEGSLSQSEHHRSHILIQEFMILANRAVAQWLAEQDIPALYRNHTARAIAPDRETMYQTLLTLGSSAAIRQRLYSWMNRAEYGPALIGHFALNLPAYCHFTSPIRRLADLINHRIVKAVLKQEDVPYTVHDLEQLGQHIAQIRGKDEEKTSEYYKAEHQKIYQDQLQTPEELGRLSSKEFTRLVKYAAENQDFERLHSELVTRLESEKLTVQDLYLLMFQGSDIELQQQVVQYLTHHVQDAASVISVASSQEKDWEEFEYIEVVDSTPFTVWLEVKRSGESLTTVHPAVHSRKQDARHQACLLWLEVYLQNSLVDPEERIQPPLPESQPVSSASSNNSAAPLSKAMHAALVKPLSGGQNFVGMLVDVCQRLRWENPEYEMDSSDDWFICKCELDVLGERLEGSGVAKKKKLAKSLAAKELLERVRELAPQYWEEWFPGVAFTQSEHPVENPHD